MSIPVEFIGGENTTKTKILRFCSKFVFFSAKRMSFKRELSMCNEFCHNFQNVKVSLTFKEMTVLLSYNDDHFDIDKETRLC